MSHHYLQCTISLMNKNPFTQQLYYCKTCALPEGQAICESCAEYCHKGHHLVDLGYFYGFCTCGNGCKNCRCYLIDPYEDMDLIDSMDERQCGYFATSTNHVPMRTFNCIRCHVQCGEFICYACAKICHATHSPTEGLTSSGAHCSCKEKTHICKMQPRIIGPSIPLCTNKAFYDNKLVKEQFYCQNCQLFVCCQCASRCHKKHKIIKSNITEQTRCCCNDNNNCLFALEIEPAA